MSAIDRIRPVILAAATAALAGCAGKPPPPPIVSLDGRNCAAVPDLTVAKSVPIASDSPVKVTLDGDSPCVVAASGVKDVYAAFLVPQSPQPYFLSIDSAPIGQGLFAPRIQLLDDSGKTLRELSPDMFTFHGVALHAGLRPHPGEKYLLVMSDKASIGQSTSRIIEATQVYTAAAGGVFLQVHTGSEETPTLVNSYNGAVSVAATPMPSGK